MLLKSVRNEKIWRAKINRFYSNLEVWGHRMVMAELKERASTNSLLPSPRRVEKEVEKVTTSRDDSSSSTTSGCSSSCSTSGCSSSYTTSYDSSSQSYSTTWSSTEVPSGPRVEPSPVVLKAFESIQVASSSAPVTDFTSWTKSSSSSGDDLSSLSSDDEDCLVEVSDDIVLYRKNGEAVVLHAPVKLKGRSTKDGFNHPMRWLLRRTQNHVRRVHSPFPSPLEWSE